MQNPNTKYRRGMMGSGFGLSYGKSNNQHDPLHQALMQDTGLLLSTLKLPKQGLLPTETEEVSLKYQGQLASYNWKDSEEPAIFVPGCPAKWSPQRLPFTASQDLNGASAPSKINTKTPPFVPVFHVLLLAQPAFSMSPISLVSNRNCLYKILKFSLGEGWPMESWRIDIDLEESTVFFSRWEFCGDQVLLYGSRGAAYGHEFENAFTTHEPGLEESASSHAVGLFEIGGIRIMMSYEVDGHLQPIDEQSHHIPTSESRDEMEAGGSDSSSVLPDGGVKIIQAGHPVAASSFIEIKTRNFSTGRRINLEYILPKLWLAKTQTLHVGYHVNGVFSEPIEEHDLRPAFEKWQREKSAQLKIYVDFLQEIRETVRKAGGSKFVLVCQTGVRGPEMRLFERTGMGLVLPDGVRERCWTGEKTTA